MRYTIEIEKSAKKNLSKIDNPFFDTINEKILALQTNPRPQGCKKLTGRDGLAHQGCRLQDYLYN